MNPSSTSTTYIPHLVNIFGKEDYNTLFKNNKEMLLSYNLLYFLINNDGKFSDYLTYLVRLYTF